jgi:hypothetical protein
VAKSICRAGSYPKDAAAGHVEELHHALLSADHQGLTLVHFSAQLEPWLSQENTLHNQNTP